MLNINVYLYTNFQRTKMNDSSISTKNKMSQDTLYCFGGGERDRTDDLLRARQALSQLSYTPEKTRTELSQSRWWAWMELNHRPHAYQACALTKLSYRPFVRAKALASIGR